MTAHSVELVGPFDERITRLMARYVNTGNPDHLLDLIKTAIIEYQRKRPNG